MNRLVPGCRVLLVGASTDGLSQQLADLGMDAMSVQSIDQFDEARVAVVVDCICEFTNEDLNSQAQWHRTADLLSRVKPNGSLCFVFNHDPSLTVTALHCHLIPFAERADQPTGHEIDQIQIEIVGKPLFSRDPAVCLAALRVPSPAPNSADWRQRAIEASTVIKSNRSAA